MILAPDDPHLIDALLDARFRRRYLAEGDSWFSLGGWTGNLLMALDDADTLIVNCAYPGDTLEDMGRHGIARALAASDGIAPWDAVLLSGGGNDLLRRCGEYIVGDPATPIEWDAMGRVLAEIEHHLVRLLVLCGAGQPGVPVYCHTYDHPPVSRRWWWWQLGPWVGPALRRAGVERSRWDELAAMLVDTLADDILHKLARRWRDLRVVETRWMLDAPDWQNEIHPKTRGYHELARPWRQALGH